MAQAKIDDKAALLYWLLKLLISLKYKYEFKWKVCSTIGDYKRILPQNHPSKGSSFCIITGE